MAYPVASLPAWVTAPAAVAHDQPPPHQAGSRKWGLAPSPRPRFACQHGLRRRCLSPFSTGHLRKMGTGTVAATFLPAQYRFVPRSQSPFSGPASTPTRPRSLPAIGRDPAAAVPPLPRAGPPGGRSPATRRMAATPRWAGTWQTTSAPFPRRTSARRKRTAPGVVVDHLGETVRTEQRRRRSGLLAEPAAQRDLRRARAAIPGERRRQRDGPDHDRRRRGESTPHTLCAEKRHTACAGYYSCDPPPILRGQRRHAQQPQGGQSRPHQDHGKHVTPARRVLRPKMDPHRRQQQGLGDHQGEVVAPPPKKP